MINRLFVVGSRENLGQTLHWNDFDLGQCENQWRVFKTPHNRVHEAFIGISGEINDQALLGSDWENMGGFVNRGGIRHC